jgi:threonine dehydratase
MATDAGVVIEGASAAAVAAVRAGRVDVGEPAAPLVIVVTGRNIAPGRLAGLLA